MTKVSTRARRAINTMTRTRERCKLKCSVSDTFQLFRVKPLLFFCQASCCKSFPSASTLLLPRRRRHAAVLSVVSRLRPLKTAQKKPENACFLGPTCHRFPIDMEQPLDECFANFFVGGGSQARQFYLNKPVKVLGMGRRAICQTDALK